MPSRRKHHNDRPFSRRAALRALRWAQAVLRMKDWRLDSFESGDDLPPAYGEDTGQIGCCKFSRNYQCFDIWVSPSRCAKQDESWLATLFHETLHVTFAAAALNVDTPAQEFLINNLSYIMERDYLAP